MMAGSRLHGMGILKDAKTPHISEDCCPKGLLEAPVSGFRGKGKCVPPFQWGQEQKFHTFQGTPAKTS